MLASGPRHFRCQPTARASLTRYENRVLLNLPFQNPRQKPRLNLQQPPIADPILEQRMRHQRIHPQFICPEEALPPVRLQRHRGPDRTKSAGVTMRVLIAVSTAESAISGRKGSIKSSASAGRPKRG